MSFLPKTTSLLAAAACSALLLAACGDDGADVRTIGDDSSGSESGSASDSGSASASGSGSGSASGIAECNPVGTDLAGEATTVVEIDAGDFVYVPASITAPAGVTTFSVNNIGEEPHELAFLPGGGEVPFVDGKPDEAALEAAGAFELEAFGAGETCDATYDLEPGTYTLFCIVETADGVTHYELGMRGTLVVE